MQQDKKLDSATVRFDDGEYLECNRENNIRYILWSSGVSLGDFLDKAYSIFGTSDAMECGGVIYDGIEICKDAPYKEVRTSSGEIPIIKNTHAHVDFDDDHTVAWSAHPTGGASKDIAEASLRFDTESADRRRIIELIRSTATNSIARHARSLVSAVRK